MFRNRQVSELSGIPHGTLRRMAIDSPIRPEASRIHWTKQQVLGLCAMRHARLAGAKLSAAVGVYEILKRADWDALRAACDDGRQYLRIIGEEVDRNLVTHRFAFDRRLAIAATQNQKPFVIVDVRHWMNRIELVAAEGPPLRSWGKLPA